MRYKAEASHAESARERAEAAKRSAQKLSSALEGEERKIDDYMSSVECDSLEYLEALNHTNIKNNSLGNDPC